MPVQPGRITRHICVEGWSAILVSGAAFAQDAMKKDAMAKDASADAMHKDAMGK